MDKTLEKNDSVVVRMIFNRLLIVQAITVSVLLTTSKECWSDTPKNANLDSAKLYNLPREQLVHLSRMNKTPLPEVISELCRRSGITAIIDKSVYGRTVTATYQDITVREMLNTIIVSASLHAFNLDDNLLLVEALGAENLQYPPILPQDYQFELHPEAQKDKSRH